jgi:surface protein
MFQGCSDFNKDLNWNVEKVTNMSNMFQGCSAFEGKGNISNWSVGEVANMSFMFQGCSKFNKDLNWNVATVTNMHRMFSECIIFDGDLSGWNVAAKVIDMSSMFAACSKFTGDRIFSLTGDNQVQKMSDMFGACDVFNGDISNWNVRNVTDMRDIFSGCNAFRRDISKWVLTSIIGQADVLLDAPKFTTEYIDAVKPLFSAEYPDSWKFDLTDFDDTIQQQLSDSVIEIIPVDRRYLYTTIEETGLNKFVRLVRNPFVSTWTITANNTQIFLPINFITNTIRVYWGDNNEEFQEFNTGPVNHTYAQGDYTIRISGRINGWSFANLDVNDVISRNSIKNIVTYGCLLDIGNTGSQFLNCTNLSTFPQPATLETLPLPFNCSSMFEGCSSLKTDLNTLVTTNVTTMANMFKGCSLFNNSIATWDVQRATTMTGMFRSCQRFIGTNLFALPNGNVVTNMISMFRGCTDFIGNPNLSNWDVRKVTDMSNIFLGCTLFSTDISKWVLTGILANTGAPTFTAQYIDVVKPKFSSAYRASWKFTASQNLNKNIINTIVPANLKEYYIDEDLRLRTFDDQDNESVSTITGSGNSSIKYSYNSRINIFF